MCLQPARQCCLPIVTGMTLSLQIAAGVLVGMILARLLSRTVDRLMARRPKGKR